MTPVGLKVPARMLLSSFPAQIQWPPGSACYELVVLLFIVFTFGGSAFDGLKHKLSIMPGPITGISD